MTESEFLVLAKSRYSKIASLKEEESFYEYEKQFEELWLELGKEVFEKSISEVGADRRKKKLNSRLGQIEISKSHPWSEGLQELQISPYLQELQVYAGQNDNYEAGADQLEK